MKRQRPAARWRSRTTTSPSAAAPSGSCSPCSRAFPEATIHTTLYDPDGTYPEFRDARIVTSRRSTGSARCGAATGAALPLLAPARRRLRVDADVVVVRRAAGGRTGSTITGRRLVYCHAPARWLYQSDDYLGGPPCASAEGPGPARRCGPLLRRWDRRGGRAGRPLPRELPRGPRADRARRTASTRRGGAGPARHGRLGQPRSRCPALTDWADDGYLLVVSRLLPYKNVDARRRGGARDSTSGWSSSARPGAGARCARCCPANVRLVSGLTDAQLRWVYAHARALVAPSHEDFGLTPLEAGAFGASRRSRCAAGGYLDTVARGRHRAVLRRPDAGGDPRGRRRRPRPVLGRRRRSGSTWSSSPRPASRRGCRPRSLDCSTGR